MEKMEKTEKGVGTMEKEAQKEIDLMLTSFLNERVGDKGLSTLSYLHWLLDDEKSILKNENFFGLRAENECLKSALINVLESVRNKFTNFKIKASHLNEMKHVKSEIERLENDKTTDLKQVERNKKELEYLRERLENYNKGLKFENYIEYTESEKVGIAFVKMLKKSLVYVDYIHLKDTTIFKKLNKEGYIQFLDTVLEKLENGEKIVSWDGLNGLEKDFKLKLLSIKKKYMNSDSDILKEPLTDAEKGAIYSLMLLMEKGL